ncbi:MAG: hydroxylamine oxidase [Desulfatitalea sp.]|nr:hydroxylamine oxidase [Desulfatitalea sp.]NNK02117.1 hydroxylamine oxidase [Desulfatitalea sp.]
MRGGFVRLWIGLMLLTAAASAAAGDAPISGDTQACLDCHAAVHPGIVADWRRSRHAVITPQAAQAVKGLARKVSAKQVPKPLQAVSVGCAECHTLRGDAHADTFAHNGYAIHIVVSPDDCAVCHVQERAEYAENIMSAAHGNLADNRLYNDLERTILGPSRLHQAKVVFEPAADPTRAEACFYCHGTRLTKTGMQTRDTDVGELEFPIIRGWPNQGVGRINLDGSRGACSSCHPRHQFDIETARKPYTCKECHAGPDVPAYKVYAASKHGNIFSATHQAWHFDRVPWTLGVDFTAPTCAACHMSLVVDSEGQTVSRRTHRVNDRLGWRIFGLIYAHPQPKSPDTSVIRNGAGMPLPTDLDGTAAAAFLIDGAQIDVRRAKMQRTCRACHGTGWTAGHFTRLDHTIASTNAEVLTATRLMEAIWEKGYAQGAGGEKGSLFDEFIERRWSDAWLMYANTIRFNAAMAGGGDYGVFADGRYHLSKCIMEMQDWLAARERHRLASP